MEEIGVLYEHHRTGTRDDGNVVVAAKLYCLMGDTRRRAAVIQSCCRRCPAHAVHPYARNSEPDTLFNNLFGLLRFDRNEDTVDMHGKGSKIGIALVAFERGCMLTDSVHGACSLFQLPIYSVSDGSP